MKDLLASCTIGGRIGKHEAENVSTEGTEVIGERDALIFDHGEVILHGHALVASFACQHFIENYS